MKRYVLNLPNRFNSFWWGEKGLTALLMLVLLSFMLGSLIEVGFASLISSIFLSLLLLSGIATISAKKSHQAAAGVVVLTSITPIWLKYFMPPSRSLDTWSDLSAIFYLSLLTLVVMGHVFKGGPVTGERIRGAMAAYILVGFTFGILYHLIELSSPGSFRLPLEAGAAADIYTTQQPQFMYHSFVTLTTVGYGDITPINPLARTFVILEALIGQLYPATLLARLVSLEIIYRNGSRQVRHQGKAFVGDPNALNNTP